MTKRTQNSLSLPSNQFKITPTGLVVKGDITFDDWAMIGPALGKYHRGIAWAVGDWLATGEHKFGEMYVQAMDTTGLSLGRLRNLKSLADRVPYENRVSTLSLSHHEAVAPFNHQTQRKLLTMADEHGIDRNEMRNIAAELHALPDGGNVDEVLEQEQVVILPIISAPLDTEKLIHVARRVIRLVRELDYEWNRVGMSLHEAVYELEELVGESDAGNTRTNG